MTAIEAQATPDDGSAKKPPLTILLAAPRGFCAGVDRAIQIVELALERFGAPVYVRHEIVHNRTVVDDLRAKGAVFVEELEEIPDNGAPVVFSAHGVAKSVPEAAARRNMFHLDATCPLVSKVHVQVDQLFGRGLEILLIGHAGHPEVVGTMGQLPEGAVRLIESVADAETFVPADADKLAYVTQTTLSVDDTREIVAVLKARFPTITEPRKNDICYATSNRQEAVKAIAPRVDAILVVGAPNSSNSVRLVEVAQKAGCLNAMLVQSAREIAWERFSNLRSLGLTAGASAPEHLIQEIITAFREVYDVTVETITTATENVTFKLPRALQESAA
ncbi:MULTISPECIES: 4-hydroxy-3-methylbut-2-enyl diphosphate reductase [Rhodomicrobium]|uniref:4-hydroxy-3-methylbut-2-enyl diphosphate reductase n=1 Tax=Rhodomicrobium TaxID=1068 RepID=UPI000B4B4571|nr:MULTISPECIES: 4-hydroxy-3-methylbut-2-enyl diphosphate reductase [Rhodomicrobium]